MGNKLSSTNNKNGKAAKGKPSFTSILSQQQEGSGFDAGVLEAELKAAQETALKLSAGVDMLADEIRLEQQLAALDEEAVEDDDDDGKPSPGDGPDDDVDIDPDELAELEGELQELEREVLGADEEVGDAAAPVEEEVTAGCVSPGEEEPLEEEEEPEGQVTDGGPLHVPATISKPSTATSAEATTVTTASLATSSQTPPASASSPDPESVGGSSATPRPTGRDTEGPRQRAAPEPSETVGTGRKPPAQAEALPPASVDGGYEDDVNDEPLAVAHFG